MSCTTTTMSAPHIWGFDRQDPELRIALQSGWRRSDLIWERLMEAANIAFADGRTRVAARLFWQASVIARFAFAPDDPRRATVMAAQAVVLQHSGRLDAAGTRQRAALQVWRNIGHHIDQMQIRPRARSSLFHLRMEARHRETYHDNLRLRLGRIARETHETLASLNGTNGSQHRHYGRWRGEKPSVFDDTRKVLGACLLLPDKGGQDAR